MAKTRRSKYYNKKEKSYKSKKRFVKKSPLDKEVIQIVEALASPLLESYDMELVHVEYRREPVGWVLRCFIDKEGGVNLDDCTFVTKELGDLLDVKLGDGISDSPNNQPDDKPDDKPDYKPDYKSDDSLSQIPPYTLEVSSPGPNRPLKKINDFLKFINEKVHVKVKEPINGQRHFKGLLIKASTDMINLKAQDLTFAIPFQAIEMARLNK